MVAHPTDTSHPSGPPAAGPDDLAQDPVGRTVRAVGHGHVFVPTVAHAESDGDPRLSVAPFLPGTEAAVRADVETGRFDATTPFDYLFRDLRAAFPARHLPSGDQATIDAVTAALEALGTAMAEPTPVGFDSSAPAVYTYWGQFIDHDITLNTNGRDKPPGPQEEPTPGDQVLGDIVDSPFRVFAPDVVVASLHNGRHPALNLDSLYGSGPQLDRPPADALPTRSEAAYVPHSAKLALGRVSTDPIGPFALVPPGADAQRDLPRIQEQDLEDPATEQHKVGSPLIPDGRNDENLVVAQLHTAMIRFHNAVVDWVKRVEPWLAVDEQAVFDRAQELVRYHYQWLVLHDYLRTLTKPGVLDAVLVEHALLYRPRRRVSVPLEFAVAAFRFGHSMVRAGYDYNLNFDGLDDAGQFDPTRLASLGDLFRFTSKGGGAREFIPSNWPIDWARFVDKGDPAALRKAHRIDPFLASGLDDLPNESPDPELDPPGDAVVRLLKHLARRNLLRGYALALPTGEAVAEELGLTPLSRAELAGEDAAVGAALAMLDEATGGAGTPLWYYVLREAEVQGNGAFLGEVGSRVVCETFVYLLREDETSYVRSATGWTPASGVRFEDGRMITTLVDLLRFAGVLVLDDGTTFRTVDGRPAGHDGA